MATALITDIQTGQTFKQRFQSKICYNDTISYSERIYCL